MWQEEDGIKMTILPTEPQSQMAVFTTMYALSVSYEKLFGGQSYPHRTVFFATPS